MKHAASLTLHAYWLSCRGKVGVPAKAIQAAELAPLLPSLFLFDLDPAADTRLRFCGAELARRFGRDLADESFLALWKGSDRELFRRHLRALTTDPVGLVAGIVGETLGGGVTSFEMLILPLHGKDAAAGAIGSMVRVGGHEETNRIRARLTAYALRSVRFLPAVVTTAARSAALLETPRSDGPGERRNRYRHLSVVSGGRPSSDAPIRG